MQFSLTNILAVVSFAGIVLAGGIICLKYPATSPWIVIPVLTVTPVVITYHRNRIRDEKKPLPIGSAFVIAFSLWAIGFILSTQYLLMEGGNGPIQYAGTPVAESIFNLRIFTVLLLFGMPILSLIVLLPIYLMKIAIRTDIMTIAIAVYIIAVICLMIHPAFIPMV